MLVPGNYCVILCSKFLSIVFHTPSPTMHINAMWGVELSLNKVREVFDILLKTQTGRVLCIRQHKSGEQLTQIIQSYWIP